VSFACNDFPHVVIVVLTWNGWEDTERCLRSLGGITYPHYSVIVSDNGSTDGTPSKVRQQFSGTIVIENRENLGYSAGNNRGIWQALALGADAVLILNNDTVVEHDFLEPLVEALEGDARLGAVSPKIGYLDPIDVDQVWFMGAEIHTRTGVVVHTSSGPASSRTAARAIIPTAAVTGCCLLVHRQALHAVGGFDERFFLTFEDSDFSLRLRAMGYELAVVPRSVIRHKVSSSFPRQGRHIASYYFIRNGLLFISQYAENPVISSMSFINHHLVRPTLGDLRRGAWGASSNVMPGLLAIFAFLLRRWGSAPRVLQMLYRPRRRGLG
jgi:GT2 family glycosyltransferase